MDELTITLRLVLAAVLAALLGLEREWKGQNAGLRTHMLVSMGACLFTLVGTYAFLPDIGMHTEAMSVDPTRVPSQVVVGIGFLGGGTILKYGFNVRGLTTAANLWLAAAVGMAVAVGYFYAACVCVVLSLLALGGLRRVEQRVFPIASKGSDERGRYVPSEKRPHRPHRVKPSK